MSSEQIIINNGNFYIDLTLDVFNKRIRVDDMRGNIEIALSFVQELVKEKSIEKLIIKVRKEDYDILLQNGFICEAKVDRYFLGNDMYFFCKYFHEQRMVSEYWLKEDKIAEDVCLRKQHQDDETPPPIYIIKKLEEADAEQLAQLYRTIFQIYPVPLDDPDYIKKTMRNGTVYYGFYCDGEIVSAASAEKNDIYKNAELTDCATLPAHRKHKLMKWLLETLEDDLRTDGIYCAYSIARALSFGMNMVLHQLGYVYKGRLLNNCYIFDKLEDMNVWVKDLSKFNGQ